MRITRISNKFEHAMPVPKRNVASNGERLYRDTPFSYKCDRCNVCCENKLIRLNPYEVMRLSAYFNMTTSEFLASCTQNHGTAVRWTKGRRCIFHKKEGCSVHSVRPLACWLYPLGRHITAQNAEFFTLLPAHCLSQGIAGKESAVADYLQQQQAGVYIEAADRYVDLFKSLIRKLRELNDIKPHNIDQFALTDNDYFEWWDIDVIVASYCKKIMLKIHVL